MSVKKLAKALSIFYDALYDDEGFTRRATFELTLAAIPIFAAELDKWEEVAD